MQKFQVLQLFNGRLLAGLIAAAIITMGFTAFSTPKWGVNFNDATTDQAPPVATVAPGEVHTKITDVSISGVGNTILVKNSFAAGTATLVDKPVVITQTSDGVWEMELDGGSADYQAGANYKVEFDMLVNSNGSSGNIFSCGLMRNGTGTHVGGMQLNTSSQSVVLYSRDNVNPDQSQSFSNSWQMNAIMHVELFFDCDSDKLSCHINNNLIGAIDLAPDDENQGVMTVVFGGASAARASMAIDNIIAKKVLSAPVVPVYNIDFNEMTADQAPVSYAPYSYPQIAGEVINKPTSITVGGANTILVKDQFSTSGDTMTGKPVVFTDTASDSSVMLEFTSNYGDYSAPMNFQLEFDVLISSSGLYGSNSIFNVELERNGTGTGVAYFSLNTLNWSATLLSCDTVNPSVTQTFNNVWNTDRIMRVKLLVDADNNQFSVWIDSTLVGSIALAPDDSNQGIRRFHFYTANANKAVFAIDNIKSPIVVNAPVIHDSELCVQFEGDTLDLRSIRTLDTGNFLAGGEYDPGSMKLFEIKFQRASSSTVLLNNKASCDSMTWKTDVIGNKQALILEWKNFDLAGENNVVDVKVTLLASRINPGIEWYINVDNRHSQYGVIETSFPFFRFRPAGATPSDDALLIPDQYGLLIPNPYDAPAYLESTYNLYAAPAGWDYPGTLNMAWMAIYDPAFGGLYMGAHDPDGYKKRFVTDPVGGCFDFNFMHYSSLTVYAGNDYSSPYPFITKHTKGSWYDAALLYRDWALQQSWASGGPLVTRSDVPAWFKDAPLLFYVSSATIPVTECAASAVRFRNFFGYQGYIPVIWYNWTLFRPTESSLASLAAGTHAGNLFPAQQDFASAVQTCASNGMYVQPYLNSRIFDVPDLQNTSFPSGWYANCMKDFWGNPVAWDASYPGLIDMCPTTTTYSNYLKNTATTLADNYNCTGVYLDQFGGLRKYCYDSSHNHEYCGGLWQTMALNTMVHDVRTEVKTVNSNAVFFQEDGSDLFMKDIDANLTHVDLQPCRTPLISVVYGGYWTCFGRAVHTSLGNDTYFRMVIGNMFVYGLKLGRMQVSGCDLFLTDPQYTVRMELLRLLASYKYSARNYLQYGRMNRPIAFASMSEVQYPFNGRTVKQPAIMSSVWEAPDGSIAVVMFNISQTSKSFSFAMNETNYPILANTVNRYQLMSDGTLTSIDTVSGTVSFSGTMAIDEIRIYVLNP